MFYAVIIILKCTASAASDHITDKKTKCHNISIASNLMTAVAYDESCLY